MLWIVSGVLVVLWLLGIITSYTLGGYIHILLVIAIIVLLVKIITGRRIA
ncbi:MAG: lmo0937 family membrane protein [Eubacteriales bacterium]